MSFQKHNVSSVLIPGAKSRQEAKREVMRSTLKDRQKFLLLWVLDQADGYVITVAQLRLELGWGEKRWITVRDHLKELGILKHFKVGLEDKTSRWTLSFNLTPIFKETEKKEGITCARDPTAWQGSRVIPAQGGDIHLNHTPPQGAGVWGVRA